MYTQTDGGGCTGHMVSIYLSGGNEGDPAKRTISVNETLDFLTLCWAILLKFVTGPAIAQLPYF